MQTGFPSSSGDRHCDNEDQEGTRESAVASRLPHRYTCQPMKQFQSRLQIETAGAGLYEITRHVTSLVDNSGIETGQATVFCRHTSASLTIQENADPDVKIDLAEFFSRLVPENMDWLRHTIEGPDDMPAHIKSALTDVSLTIPVSGGAMVLGTWQGIYLFEHRSRPHRREIVVHLVGE